MPIITQTGNPSNSLTIPGWTLADEFLPLLKFDNPSKYNVKDEELIPSGDSVKLSKYLDKPNQNLKVLQLTTEKNTISLPFKILKGSDDSDDEDGIVTVKLSTNDPKIKLKSKNEFKSSYGSKYSLELEMNPEKSLEFFVDFYAKDDNKDEYNEGELSDVHCGRIKVVFNIKTVCSDWPTITSIIPKNKFVGWDAIKHPDWECYDYCVKQLKDMGYSLEATSWRDWSESTLKKSKGIFQIFLEADVAGMKKGIQEKEFIEGIKYMKEAIKNDIPIMVGVDDGYHTYNADKTTEHFVVIVGMGKDNKGKYFSYYDNASGQENIGASNLNKLYCDCKNYKLSGKGHPSNTYLSQSSKGIYVVTQIRKSK